MSSENIKNILEGILLIILGCCALLYCSGKIKLGRKKEDLRKKVTKEKKWQTNLYVFLMILGGILMILATLLIPEK
ncbi:MAG: hypothetical protein ACOZBW_04550 [Thermodesulfobacteriota bacterium]